MLFDGTFFGQFWKRKRLVVQPEDDPKEPRLSPKEDPKEPAYWLARGRKYGNILAVAYRWGQIDEEGRPMPEPHVSREKN